MGLTRSMVINCLKVNNTSGAAIMLCCDNHSAAPFCWFINRDPLDDSKSFVTVKACLDILYPVGGNLAGLMDGHWLGIF